MICKVRSLKSRIETCPFLEEIIPSSNEAFKDFESNVAVSIRMLGNPTREADVSYVIVTQNPGSYILTPELLATISDL